MVLYSDIKIRHGEYQLITKGFLVVWSLLILADLDWSALLCYDLELAASLVLSSLIWSGLVYAVMVCAALLFCWPGLSLVWNVLV